MLDLMKQVHRLASKNLETMTGVCIECGPVELLPVKNGVRCAVGRRAQRGVKPPEKRNLKRYDKPGRDRQGPHGLLQSVARRLRALIGQCQLCGKRTLALNVDHCHDSRAIRGVLCRQCNTGLGKLGDTVESLERALEYLRHPPIGKTVAEVTEWVWAQD